LVTEEFGVIFHGVSLRNRHFEVRGPAKTPALLNASFTNAGGEPGLQPVQDPVPGLALNATRL
jgi:hypothetical protein